jgi:predicted AlkP superfamily pyrophosphatase or phosphodiesterase
MKKRLLVVSVAGLGPDEARELSLPGERTFAPLETTFPAVTCTAQATFRTAASPASHGMIANGFYDRALDRAFFWEQSSRLVAGRRIWSACRERGGRVGLLFWQQSIGEAADLVVSPAPIHKHGGGMVVDCYSRPREVYPRLRSRLGTFPLHRYWGPWASAGVGDWIAAASVDVLRADAPDVLLTYLPTLDYDMQRFGPRDPRCGRARGKLAGQLAQLLDAAEDEQVDWLVWGDYVLSPCGPLPVRPNRLLRDAGLFACRDVGGRLYPDLPGSRAFALVDHAVAHVYVRDPADVPAAADVLRQAEGVGTVLAGAARAARGLDHPRAGELVLSARAGAWFAYSWWDRAREAPDYASHVDIHNKPGFDPCELHAQWFPPGITRDPGRIGGTHGDNVLPAAWASSVAFDPAPRSLVDLAAGVEQWLG